MSIPSVKAELTDHGLTCYWGVLKDIHQDVPTKGSRMCQRTVFQAPDTVPTLLENSPT